MTQRDNSRAQHPFTRTFLVRWGDMDFNAAKVTSTGGWLDLAERRLVSPPAALADLLRSLPSAEDFQELASSVS